MRFLRHTISRLPMGDDAISAEALYKRAGPTFARKQFSKDQQGKWLGKVGVKSRDMREGGRAGLCHFRLSRGEATVASARCRGMGEG